MPQANSRCQMRTEERGTDAEREMMSKMEYGGRQKQTEECLAEEAAADGMA